MKNPFASLTQTIIMGFILTAAMVGLIHLIAS
jgi:hypothetical protein